MSGPRGGGHEGRRRASPGVSADPLVGTDRLLVDGSNLLHALARGEERLGEAAPAAALIGRLRAAIDPAVGIEIVLDGPPDPGMHNTRVASGLIVRHSGRRTADQLIVWLIDEARRAAGPGGQGRRSSADNLLVVTDDRELGTAVRARGGRTVGARWLFGKLERRIGESPAIGRRRAPTPPSPAGSAEAEEEPRWRPGRGATVKRGNPKRGRRRAEPGG
jgi:hypothetical protein